MMSTYEEFMIIINAAMLIIAQTVDKMVPGAMHPEPF